MLYSLDMYKPDLRDSVFPAGIDKDRFALIRRQQPLGGGNKRSQIQSFPCSANVGDDFAKLNILDPADDLFHPAVYDLGLPVSG